MQGRKDKVFRKRTASKASGPLYHGLTITLSKSRTGDYISQGLITTLEL